jgi:radical SAM protein with 4Fe4S-binding SPASM domain
LTVIALGSLFLFFTHYSIIPLFHHSNSGLLAMQSLPYVDFSSSLHSRAVARRAPVNGTIEVTRRCPLRCLHCYNNLPLGDQEARSNELTFGEHCRILDEISDAGCLWLLYTGGEIFARDDFLEIYTYAKKKGLIVSLFTNGTLINEQVADTLAEWRPFSIEISIYGRTKETFERITQIPGSYDRCMRGIRLLRERNLPLTLKTMVLTVNQREIGEMKRFVLQDLGLEFKYDAMINPRVDGSRGPLRLRLTPEEIVALDVQDSDRSEEWRALSNRSGGTHRVHEASNKLYQCGGGLTSFAIDPYGKMGVCTLSQHDRWDLRSGNFDKGWNEFLFQLRQKKIARPSKCITCGIKDMCTMCPVNGELENGDPETPVDFFCRIAHLRAYALDIPVRPHGQCEYCKGGNEYQRLMDEAATLKSRKDGNIGENEEPGILE